MTARSSSLYLEWYASAQYSDNSLYYGNPSLLAYKRVHYNHVRTANVLIDVTSRATKITNTNQLRIPIEKHGDFTSGCYLRVLSGPFLERYGVYLQSYTLYRAIESATLFIGGGIMMEKLTGEWMLIEDDLKTYQGKKSFSQGEYIMISLPFCFSRKGNPLPCSYMAQEAEIVIDFNSLLPPNVLSQLQVHIEYVLLAEPYRSKIAAYSQDLEYRYDTFIFSDTQWFSPGLLTQQFELPYISGLCKALYWTIIRDENILIIPTPAQEGALVRNYWPGGGLVGVYDNVFAAPTTLSSCELMIPGIGKQRAMSGYFYTRMMRYLRNIPYSSINTHSTLQHVHIFPFAHNPFSLHETGHFNLSKMDGRLQLNCTTNPYAPLDQTLAGNLRLGINVYMQTVQILVIKGLQCALRIENTFI
jgi:hypothetical protein